jgi:hypothetical protein
MNTKDDGLFSSGITFSVEVESQDYDCLVSGEALSELIKMSDGLIAPFQAYAAYKSRIHGVARRLVAAGIGGSPVILRARHFEMQAA